MRLIGLAVVLAFNLVLTPLPTEAQQARGIPRIGWLYPGVLAAAEDRLRVFREGMKALGHIEGQTYVLEARYADGKLERLRELATELVKLPVDVLVVAGTPGVLAAKEATTTIPIVFPVSSDPVSTGLVSNLARPGGNVTGLSLMASDLSAKRLALLLELVQRMKRVAILWDSSNPGMALRVKETQAAANQAKLTLDDAGARNLDELEASLTRMRNHRPDALLVTVETFTLRHLARIIEFASQQRIPAMYEDRTFVDAGGLASYGPSNTDNFRRSATYVDKILKGAKPGDLPVEQPTKFELVINLKTAKALGLTIPATVLLQADQVIE
jgi:ABC-type uncharacterized transport system substrate-binding protein